MGGPKPGQPHVPQRGPSAPGGGTREETSTVVPQGSATEASCAGPGGREAEQGCLMQQRRQNPWPPWG